MFRLDGEMKSHLFIERTIPERVVWDGEKMSKDKAKEISGVDTVYYLDDFDTAMQSFLTNVSSMFLEIGGSGLNEPLSKALLLANKVRERYPNISFESIKNRVSSLRMKKDDFEVENLRKAIELTGKGINKALSCKWQGLHEYELEAIIYHEMHREGVRNWGFKPIIAAGKNAATLHYCQNDKLVGKNELVLIDIGALYNNYSADITRTYPSGKKFQARQKAVYQEVLEVQKSVISVIEPGITLKDLNQKTCEMLTEAMLRLKLIKDKSEFRKFYMHSVSHYLGMEAHDINSGNTILECGNVITVEPGLYIPEEGIGVRIEDDVLVTERGYEVLSASIPKEIDEIEEIRASALGGK
jgi:Xaa-Pro aminopeptidase